MRRFDWIISGLVALLYADHGTDLAIANNIAEKYNPELDVNILLAYTAAGEWHANFPFIFNLTAAACFLAACFAKSPPPSK